MAVDPWLLYLQLVAQVDLFKAARMKSLFTIIQLTDSESLLLSCGFVFDFMGFI